MDNYEYLIASLPVLSQDWTAHSSLSADAIIGEIKNGCSKKDNVLIDALLSGYMEENLNEDFYKTMKANKNKFISEFFTFDLRARNAKVRYLNDRLRREADQDIFLETEPDVEEDALLEAVFSEEDLLKREKGLDSLMWEKISDLTLFDYFNINVILGFIAKLKIIDRWIKLDDETGRQMFKRLVDEIRGTFKGVEYNDN